METREESARAAGQKAIRGLADAFPSALPGIGSQDRLRVWPVMKARRSDPLSTSRRRRVPAPFSIATPQPTSRAPARPGHYFLVLPPTTPPTTWAPLLLFLFLTLFSLFFLIESIIFLLILK